MNGLSPETSEKPYPSSPDQNLFTPPHSGQDAAREISSSERRQYNKALKAMYEIVRLGSKRLEKPVTDGDHDDDDDDDDDDMIPETVTETSETEEDLSGLLFYFYSFALLIGLKYLILFNAPFDSLWKHLFLLALCCWGRFAQRNGCDSATEILYWWRKSMFT